MPLGSAIGFLLPFARISSSPLENKADTSSRRTSLQRANFLYAIVFSGVLTLCLLPQLRKPLAARKGRSVCPEFRKLAEGVKSLATNGNFMILAISFALIQMVVCVTHYNLAAILFPFDYFAVLFLLDE
eukprot:TRINITY_DN4265_c0_g1_i1.p1 TRINITY_DN4265_c0_g1~~TRINITY_DN4265_c0_g1_i1.p1  ORF type:complete len:129 (-),score=20.83 TRINITY_DN4265_c0_g1_i1:782-1168(-)